jgi:hypothetical protein
MKIKNFDEFYSLYESKINKKFTPKYFSLPYNIPEDRFENGFLKTNTSRRTNKRRNIIVTTPKYKSKKDFLSKVSYHNIQNKIDVQVNKVLKFIKDNKLTGKTIDANYEQHYSIEKFLNFSNTSEIDETHLGAIYTNLPFSEFSISVSYDIYKDCIIFTFLQSDMMYYYTVFTLEPNDVLGGGEQYTYITADEVIDQMFYETVWREAISVLYNNYFTQTENAHSILSKKIGYNIEEISINSPYPITSNYFNKKFAKFIKQWITSGSLNFAFSKLPEFPYSWIGSPGDILELPSETIEFVASGPSTPNLPNAIDHSGFTNNNSIVKIKFSLPDMRVVGIEKGLFTKGRFTNFQDNDNKIEWTPYSMEDVKNSIYLPKNRSSIKLKDYLA